MTDLTSLKSAHDMETSAEIKLLEYDYVPKHIYFLQELLAPLALSRSRLAYISAVNGLCIVNIRPSFFTQNERERVEQQAKKRKEKKDTHSSHCKANQ